MGRWWSEFLWERAARRIGRGKRLGWIGWAAFAFDKSVEDNDPSKRFPEDVPR